MSRLIPIDEAIHAEGRRQPGPALPSSWAFTRADRSTMHHDDRTRTSAVLLAWIGGLAWVVDVGVIIAINDSFDPLDSILFVGGLVCLAGMAVLVGALATRGLVGFRRALVAAGIALAVVVVLGLLSTVFDAASHALYHGDNRGLHEECGILSIALGALVIGSLLRRPPRRALDAIARRRRRLGASTV
jgi:hypothetical protein